jgi:Protein of unknown function (DUF3617)
MRAMLALDAAVADTGFTGEQRMKSLSIVLAGAILAAGAAQADEFATRKPGEWQVTVIGPDGKPQAPHNFCWGPGSIDDIAKAMDNCSKRDIGKTGNVTVIDAICSKAGHQITMHVTIAAASDSAYHSEAHMTYSPAMAGMTNIDIASDAKWLGPCAPGEKPSH